VTAKPAVEACPGCGLQLPALDAPRDPHLGASPACWALYGRLLIRHYGDAASSRVHRLTVDAYAAQHPGSPDRCSIRALCLHLIGLCLLLERGASAHQTPELPARVLEHAPALCWLAPPTLNQTLTVSDVVAAGTPRERAQLVEHWAGNVWAAWALHHQTVRAWIDGTPP
jgi:hypothetical protein